MHHRGVAVICLTSNGYVNCVEPFAHYWNMFVSKPVDVTVACYDVLPPRLPDNFSVYQIGKQADHTWSSGLLSVLERCSAEYILLMLEDYFLTTPFDWDEIGNFHQRMLYAPDVFKIDLSGDRLKHPYVECAPGVVVNDWQAPFQTSVQAALWCVDFLKKFLDPRENAWEFEKNGTNRLIAARGNGDFIGFMRGAKHPPMQYANAVGGAGSKPGVIESKHMPDWMWQECLEKGWAHG